MRIYWCWPFARQEETGIAHAVLRDGDSLVIQTSDGRARPTLDPSSGPFEVVPTLPDVVHDESASLRWAAARARTYCTRAIRRHRLARSGFDVGHIIYLNYFTDWLALGALPHGMVLVGTVHDLEPHEPRLPEPLQRRLLRTQYRHLDAIVVHHERLRASLVDRFGVDESRIEVIPQQVPVPDRGPAERNRSQSDRGRLVLFFGTLRADKGIPVLAEAISALGDLKVRFHIAGRGDPFLERLVRDMAARDSRVTAEIGYASAARKAELLRDADVVVLPYTSFAAQSAVLHDAYSYGTPVIVTDTGAVGCTVREDGSGWVVRPGDPAELAAAFREALTDEATHREAAKRAAAVAAERHPAVVGRAMRDLYERLVQERSVIPPQPGGASSTVGNAIPKAP